MILCLSPLNTALQTVSSTCPSRNISLPPCNANVCDAGRTYLTCAICASCLYNSCIGNNTRLTHTAPRPFSPQRGDGEGSRAIYSNQHDFSNFRLNPGTLANVNAGGVGPNGLTKKQELLVRSAIKYWVERHKHVVSCSFHDPYLQFSYHRPLIVHRVHINQMIRRQSLHLEADGVTYSFGVFYLTFLHYFNEGKGATAWIASILVGVTLCSGPISSSFVNKYGCRAVTIAGSVLASVCMAISVFAPNVITLYLTIGLGTGFGFGLIYLPAIVSVTCYFEKYRSLATGIAVCGSGLGTFIFAPLTEYLVTEYGWRGAMLIIAALVLNCMILGALFRPVPDNRGSKPVSRSASSNGITPHTNAHTTNLLVEKNNSERDLHQVTSMSNGDGGLHRPRSIGHFTMPHSGKIQSKSQTGGSDVARLALSQPVLLTSASSTDPRFRPTFGSQSLRKSSGIMYRRDIFYRGSLHNIPYHRSNPWIPQDTKHTEESHQLMELNGLNSPKQRQEEEDDDRMTICGCMPCSKETRDTLTEMLDFSLLKDPIFVLFTVSNFCTSVGFNIPYVYLAAQAEERGISTDKASLLLSVIGIANLVGRIILGYVSDKPWINRLLVYNVCLTICGIATALSALCYDFYSFVIYASVYGFTIGAYVGLTSVILVDLLGLDHLTNAFGLLLLFQGIASFLGPPIAGWLYDAVQSYNPGFYVAGVTIAASGIMLFCIPSLQRYVIRRKDIGQNKKSALHQNGNATYSPA